MKFSATRIKGHNMIVSVMQVLPETEEADMAEI